MEIDIFGVRHLGSSIPYQDGVEDNLLQIVSNSLDRSTASDELAGSISDWPTRYHFSRLRSGLFQPLRVASNHRVLEIGCGTGVNLRYFGERGAHVVGVEGSLARARTASLRCIDLENVSVYAGDIADFSSDEKFDVVLLIGVLEYSGSPVGGGQGPEYLLEVAESHLADGGILVIAIENRFGLKYLAGYPEDHLGEPWVGIDGYHSGGGIRTWSRTALENLLHDNAFEATKWFYPFPDYKLPTFVSSHEFLENPETRVVAAQFARPAIFDHSGRPARLSDSNLLLSDFIENNFGPDIANSFLIVCSRNKNSLDKFVREGLGWLQSGERLSKWRTRKQIVVGPQRELQIQTQDFHASSGGNSRWLSQTIEAQRVVLPGENLEDLLLRTIASDTDRFRYLLLKYKQFLVDAQVASQPGSSPFSSDRSGRGLPADFLDCTPKNIVISDEHLTFIDREWISDSTLSLSSIFCRGLWELGWRVINSGLRHPWGTGATLRDLIQNWSAEVDLHLTDLDIDMFCRAEIDFQSIVVGINATPNHKAAELELSIDTLRTSLFTLLVGAGERRALQQRDAAIQQRDAAIQQRDAAIQQRDAAIQQRDAMHLNELSAIDDAFGSQAELHEVQRRLTHEQDNTSQLQSDIAELTNRLQREMTRAYNAERRIGEIEQQITLVYGSRTWRIGRVILTPLNAFRRLRGSAR